MSKIIDKGRPRDIEITFINTKYLYSYNTIAPKLIQNWNNHSSTQFKQLNYMEAALFVILANNLFSAW